MGPNTPLQLGRRDYLQGTNEQGDKERRGTGQKNNMAVGDMPVEVIT